SLESDREGGLVLVWLRARARSDHADEKTEQERRCDEGADPVEVAVHGSSFREGLCARRSGRSSDSGRPPSPPSQPGGQWRRGGGASPLTAAGPCRTYTGFP